MSDMIKDLMQFIIDTVTEADVDYPIGREGGPRIEFDTDVIEARIRASLAAIKLETKPAAFEVLDHVNGTYVTTNEQSALATEFPYNGLYRRVGALKP